MIEANQSGLIAEPLVDITPQVGGLRAERRHASAGFPAGAEPILVCAAADGLRLTPASAQRAAHAAPPPARASQLPLPTFSHGPLDPGCEGEGAIVCHNGHIKGQQVRGRAARGACKHNWQQASARVCGENCAGCCSFVHNSCSHNPPHAPHNTHPHTWY